MNLFYVTFPNKKSAEKICEKLIQQKIIGCANMFPMRSMSVWKKKFVNIKEYAALLKTPASEKTVQKAIKKIHPYTLPCILKISVKANKPYLKWIQQNVNQSS